MKTKCFDCWNMKIFHEENFKDLQPCLNFVSQALLLSRVQSPFVVHYLESGKSKRRDIYWFVTELLNGNALDEVLQHEGPTPEKAAIKVCFIF